MQFSLGRSGGRGFRRLVVCLLLLTGIPYAVPAQECSPPEQARDEWNLRAVNVSDLLDDIGNPRVIRHETQKLDREDAKLATSTDMHALYDVPLRAFEQVIRDINAHEDFVPRIVESTVVCSDADPATYARVRHDLSFKFLFFGSDYSYRVHYFIEDMLEEREALRTWWTLDESIDGDMSAITGSWYFERIDLNGTEYTYVRYATQTVFRETVFGLKGAFQRFGANDVARMMDAMRDEAVTRSAMAKR